MKSAIFSNEDIMHKSPVPHEAGRFSRQGSVCRLGMSAEKYASRRWLDEKIAQTAGQGVAVLRQGKGGPCHQRQGAECRHVRARAFRAQSYGGKRILSKGLDALYEGRRAIPTLAASIFAPSRLCASSRSILEAGKTAFFDVCFTSSGMSRPHSMMRPALLSWWSLHCRVRLASAAPAKIPSVRPRRSSA